MTDLAQHCRQGDSMSAAHATRALSMLVPLAITIVCVLPVYVVFAKMCLPICLFSCSGRANQLNHSIAAIGNANCHRVPWSVCAMSRSHARAQNIAPQPAPASMPTAAFSL